MEYELQPIDDFVIKGFQQRFYQQFECELLYVTTNEEAVVAARAREGKPLTYPYAFLRLQTTSPNTESYNPGFLLRNGLVAKVEDNNLVAHKVFLAPTNFEVEVKFVTAKFKSTEQGSVLAFIRRWLIARRRGLMSFNIRYGRLSISIAVSLSESVPFSPRENAPDSETAYQVVTSATIHGYISEPETTKVGVVNQVAIQELLESQGLSGGQFFPFN